MTDIEQKRIFSKNLNNYLSIRNKTQKEVADSIHVSPQTFNTWCQGIALPRMGKVQLLADYFGIEKSDLIEEKNAKQEQEQIANNEATAIGQEILKNEELRKLFEASKDVTQEDLRNINALLLSLKKANKEK